MYPVFTIGTGSAGSLQSLHIDSVTGPLSYNPITILHLVVVYLNISGLITSSYSTAAVSGELGYVTPLVTFGAQAVANDTTLKNLGSISLGAGTWLVLFNIQFTRTNIIYTGYGAEISTTSTVYDNNYSRIQERYENNYTASNSSYYSTRMVYYSGTSFLLYGNVSGLFSGAGTLSATGDMQATRIA